MTTAVSAAVAAAALAAWLAGCGPPLAARIHTAAVRDRPRWRAPLGRSSTRVVVAAGAAAALVAGGCLGPAAVVPAGVVAAEVVRRLLAARRQRAADALADALPELCSALAAELQAGRSPVAALAAAVNDAPPALALVVRPVVSAAELGGDIPTGLRAAAATPGGAGLQQIGACWAVTAEVGAGLASALRRLGDGLRAGVRLRREVAAQLAGARATGRLLAVLPLLGLGLGSALGAAPGRFLLHTEAGAGCLAVATLLDIAGLIWLDRIAARVLVAQ